VVSKAKEIIKGEGAGPSTWQIHYEKFAENLKGDLKTTAVTINPADLNTPEAPPVRKAAAQEASQPKEDGIIQKNSLPDGMWDRDVWLVEKGGKPFQTKLSAVVGRKESEVRLMAADGQAGWLKYSEFIALTRTQPGGK
jgi:hypothetical protein